MRYNIKLKMKLAPHQLKRFKKFLKTGPYGTVNKMLDAIDTQVKTQDMNAAAATSLETPAPAPAA